MYTVLLFLHIMGACAWVGGHLILLFIILPEARRRQSPEYLLQFEKNYEKIGFPTLFTQIITGSILFTRLLSPHDFTTTHPIAFKLYIKIGLLALTFMLAIYAKFFILKNLTTEKLKVMKWYVGVVTLLSLAFILAGLNFKSNLF